MPVATTADLFAVLRELRLLEPAQLQEVRSSIAPRCPDPKNLARELVKRGWATTYQINQIFLGRQDALVLGPYLLLERMGEGGMGTVFKARHAKLGRLVCLKLMRKERLANPLAIRRFHREIRAAAQLVHPNIVRAFDADEVGGHHFFVMEYVEGIDLSKLVRERGPLPFAQACDYLRQAALGLQHAADCGMVHRDIKPANLLLTQGGRTSGDGSGSASSVKLGGPGIVKILDMGLARVTAGVESEDSTALTQEGSIMGTPDYIAPEQARSASAVDIRADLYSLGCTFYFLLTGTVPFPGGSLTEKLLRHQMDTPRSPCELKPELPRAAEDVLRRLMAKRPEDRFQTPAELAAALQDVLGSGALPPARVPQAAPPEPLLDPQPNLGSPQQATHPLAGDPTDAWQRELAEAVNTPMPTAAPAAFRAATGQANWWLRHRWPLAAGSTVFFLLMLLLLVLLRRGGSRESEREKEIVPGKKTPRTSLESIPLALAFDGAVTRVEFPDLKYDGSHPLTIEAFVVPTRAVPTGTIVGDFQGGGVGLFYNGAFYLQVGSNKGTLTIRGEPAAVDHRHHVACVVDGSEARLYVDGKPAGTNPLLGAFVPSTAPFQMGVAVHSGSRYHSPFAGIVDDLRFSRVARYSAAFTPPASMELDSKTLALYRFDDGNGKVVPDAAGKYPGILRNGRRVILKPGEEKPQPFVDPTEKARTVAAENRARAAATDLVALAKESSIAKEESHRIEERLRAFLRRNGGTPAATAAVEKLAGLRRDRPSPFDKLQAADLPADARATWRAAGWALDPDLVAAFGSHARRHLTPIRLLAFAADGKTVRSVAQDRHARSLEVATGKEVVEPVALDGPWVPRALAADGRLLAWSAVDTRPAAVQLFDLAAGRPGPALADSEDVLHVAFTRDGSQVVGTTKGTKKDEKGTVDAGVSEILVWNAASGAVVRRIPLPRSYPTEQFLAVTPDGKKAACTRASLKNRNLGEIVLFDLETGADTVLLSTNNAPYLNLAHLAFSPDGKLLAWSSTSRMGLVDLDAAAQTWTGTGYLPAVFAPDGKSLVDGRGNRIETASGKREGRYPIWGVPVFSADGTVLALGGHDGIVHLFETAEAAELHPPAGPMGKVDALYVDEEDSHAALAGSDGTIALVDVRTRKEQFLRGTDAPLKAFGFLAEPGELLTLERSALQSRTFGAAVPRPRGQVPSTPAKTRLSHDRKLLAVVLGKDLLLLDTAKGDPKRLISNVPPAASVGFSFDDATLGLGSTNGDILLWDVASGQEQALWTENRVPVRLLFPPDGRSVLVAGSDLEVRLRDPADGSVRQSFPLTGCRHPYHLEQSPDGRFLAAAGQEGLLTLFDLRPGKEGTRLKSWTLPAPAQTLAIARDSRHILAGNLNGTALVFRFRE